MFTLDRDNGNLIIDFTVGDPEHPDLEPTVTRVVVAPPPTTGDYWLLREKIDEINRGRDQLSAQLLADNDVGAAEMTSRINGWQEDQVLEWWKMVMFGDTMYPPRATPPPPTDIKVWPLYLVNADAMQQALAHWKTVPLEYGASPVPKMS